MTVEGLTHRQWWAGGIMRSIHEVCVRHGRRADGTVSYVNGANVGGFVKVADAMLAQGVI